MFGGKKEFDESTDKLFAQLEKLKKIVVATHEQMKDAVSAFVII